MRAGFRRPYTGKVRAVIFDWAGTVVDHGCCAPAGVFVQTFAEHGLDITIEQARGPMGVHKREHVRLLLGLDAVRQQFEKRHRRPAGEADIDAIYT
ncbi:MAG: phosphonoacetaldehyde hydrolase, partial [Deltaproteobacteria bacterium]|nr:phosphonoacetaldehyde hydrolase [Deltaproteobacteria bacterium]